MIVIVAVGIGILITASLGVLVTALVFNAKEISDNNGMPRIEFKEFKELSKWVHFEENATYVSYVGKFGWQQFTFRYWDLLRYKVWQAKKKTEEARATADRRRKREQTQLEELRRLAEEKKNSGRG